MSASAVARGHWPGTGLQVTALSWAAAEGRKGLLWVCRNARAGYLYYNELDFIRFRETTDQVLTFSGRSVWGCLTGADFQKVLSTPSLPSTALGATQNEKLE